MEGMSEALNLLNEVFGYSSFRGFQETVVDEVKAGRDVLVLMPTGGGKSLCFQIPALLRSGVAIVISPLIALMQDQVAALRRRGVAAAYLNSSLSMSTRQAVMRDVQQDRLKLLYVSPERLLLPSFLAVLGGLYQRRQLALFAVDEAHCVAEWGHDFRPEYRQLLVLGQRFSGVPRVALTASADPATRQDILTSLGMLGARSFVGSFDRPNLYYRVVKKTRPWPQLMDFLRQFPITTAGIVYCPSRRLVELLATRLAEEGWAALAYHAGLTSEVRALHQARFLAGRSNLMVATLAFGMGVDKADIRYVVHWSLPNTLESYYQETGRAGRDGQPADVMLLYDPADLAAHRGHLKQGHEPWQVQRQTRLEAMGRYAEADRCRRQILLDYFGEHYSGSCGGCDYCAPDCVGGSPAFRPRHSPCPVWSQRQPYRS